VKYMFLLYNEEDGELDGPPSADQMAPWMEFGEYTAGVAAQESGAALQPSATATTVSIRDGKTVTTDGPFVDTKEMVGGYYAFDCENIDVAIDLAAHVPWATTGHIEVRPVMDMG